MQTQEGVDIYTRHEQLFKERRSLMYAHCSLPYLTSTHVRLHALVRTRTHAERERERERMHPMIIPPNYRRASQDLVEKRQRLRKDRASSDHGFAAILSRLKQNETETEFVKGKHLQLHRMVEDMLADKEVMEREEKTLQNGPLDEETNSTMKLCSWNLTTQEDMAVMNRGDLNNVPTLRENDMNCPSSHTNKTPQNSRFPTEQDVTNQWGHAKDLMKSHQTSKSFIKLRELGPLSVIANIDHADQSTLNLISGTCETANTKTGVLVEVKELEQSTQNSASYVKMLQPVVCSNIGTTNLLSADMVNERRNYNEGLDLMHCMPLENDKDLVVQSLYSSNLLASEDNVKTEDLSKGTYEDCSVQESESTFVNVAKSDTFGDASKFDNLENQPIHDTHVSSDDNGLERVLGKNTRWQIQEQFKHFEEEGTMEPVIDPWGKVVGSDSSREDLNAPCRFLVFVGEAPKLCEEDKETIKRKRVALASFPSREKLTILGNIYNTMFQCENMSRPRRSEQNSWNPCLVFLTIDAARRGGEVMEILRSKECASQLLICCEAVCELMHAYPPDNLLPDKFVNECLRLCTSRADIIKWAETDLLEAYQDSNSAQFWDMLTHHAFFLTIHNLATVKQIASIFTDILLPSARLQDGSIEEYDTARYNLTLFLELLLGARHLPRDHKPQLCGSADQECQSQLALCEAQDNRKEVAWMPVLPAPTPNSVLIKDAKALKTAPPAHKNSVPCISCAMLSHCLPWRRNRQKESLS